MSCCYDHHHCHGGHHGAGYMPYYPHYAGPPRSARLPAARIQGWLPGARLENTAPEPAEEGRYLFVACKR
jgi:hypothetical protein